MEESLGFESVAIKQKKNAVSSRISVPITSEVIRGVYLDIPLIAANMSTVCNSSFCILLSKLGAMGVLHRAATVDHLVSEVIAVAKECEWVAASVGVGEDQFLLAKSLIAVGANIIFIDVAHGYCDAVIDLGRAIKSYSKDTKVVLGNTVNVGLLYESYRFADAVKVGIAQGAVCETKNTAGCTDKQFSAVLKFKQLADEYDIPVISDGGIREPADFVKAIGAGANSVMAGKIFAMCPESAAEIISRNDKEVKVYAGMASRYVRERWKGPLKAGTCPEGKVSYLDIGESCEKLLERYGGALRSGITYSGGFDVPSFQYRVEFIRLI